MCWCHRHNQPCKLCSQAYDKKLPQKALEVHGAGTRCKDESNMGAKLHDAGPSQVAFKLWMYERKRQEALILRENTVEFKSEWISEVLSETHNVYTMVLCPSRLGYPVRRPRRLTLCIRKDSMLTTPIDKFWDVMGRKLAMNPGAFFCLDNESFSKYTKAEKEGLWARSNGRKLSAGQPQNATWWQLMLPTQQVRLHNFMIKVLPPD